MYNPANRAIKEDGNTQAENRADVVLVPHPKNTVTITHQRKSEMQGSTEASGTEKHPATNWNAIDWHQQERRVRNLRQRI
jgi:hypothetical protein